MHVAVLPFTVLAVIIASPADWAVIVPALTVATSLLLVDHVTDLFIEFSGTIVLVKAAFPPINKFISVLH